MSPLFESLEALSFALLLFLDSVLELQSHAFIAFGDGSVLLFTLPLAFLSLLGTLLFTSLALFGSRTHTFCDLFVLFSLSLHAG